MRSMIHFLFLFLITNLVSAQITTRVHPACGLLLGKVYCFGGAKVVDQDTATDDNVVNVLDLTNASGSTAAQLMNSWRTASPDTTLANYDVRLSPQAIAIDDTNFLINGGFTTGTPSHQTIVYNANDNKFYGETDYKEPPYGARQIYYGAAVNVPGKGIALYGGFEVHINTAWVTNATDTSAFNFNSNVSRTIGYVQPVFYNQANTNSNPWSTPLDRMTRQAFFAARLQGIYDPVNKWILYLGGEKRSNNAVNYTQNAINRPFSEALAFSTENNTWIPVALTGDVPASGRYSFTLTLLPSTNRHVLLYGGDDNGIVSGSYCYILNLDTRTWSQKVIQAPNNVTLARSEHQAVLVNNETVFIVWGRNGNKQGVDDMVMLNVSDPNQLTLLTKYIDPSQPLSGDDDANYKGGEGSGLSTGGKAGVAVACVVVAALAGLVIAYYYRKKRNERRRRERQQQLEYESHQDHDAVPMEVDWDKIEEKYIELPQTNFGTTASTSMSATMVGDNDHHPPTLVHPDGIDLDRPHAYETNHRPQKPDGFA